MLVEVYKNLHKTTVDQTVYSVRSVSTRRVVAHVADITLKNATFVVKEKGRQRVIARRRKEVHAWVRGEWCEEGVDPMIEGLRVRYNPYNTETFVDQEGNPVFSAAFCTLTHNEVRIRESAR